MKETEAEEKKEKKGMTEICHDIAESLMKLYNFKTIVGKKDDEIWVYDNGIYKPIGKNVIKAKVEMKLSSICKTHNVNEVINKIARRTQITREKFICKDINLVCVNNGVLNLKTRELSPHAPDYNFTNKVPIDYVKKVQCDKIFEFLNDVIIEEDVDCIQEWFGYQLYREYFIKKSAIFRGIPDTGKTTFINLLIAFIGEDNISSVNLQSLAQGKWYVTQLHNKYANVCDDLSEKDIVDSGTFKQVTGRSPIQAEFKFGDQFQFVNYAKLTFACNKVPEIKTNVDDEAYWNRWMIFDFENVFNKSSGNVDTHMINKLLVSKELSGLLNWALDGLDRLMKKNFFSYRRDWEENRRIMQGEASSVAKYVHDCLINETEAWISNEELYDKYQKYCNLNGISAIETHRKFYLDMRNYCNYGKFNSNKNNVFGVRNVKIRSPLPIMGL